MNQLLPPIPITMEMAKKIDNVLIYSNSNIVYNNAESLAISLIETDDYNYFANNFVPIMRNYVFSGRDTSSETVAQTLFQLAICNKRFNEAKYILNLILPSNKRQIDPIILNKLQKEYDRTVNYYYDFVNNKLVGLADTLIRIIPAKYEANILDALKFLKKMGGNILIPGFNNAHPIVSAIYNGYSTIVKYYITEFPELKTQIVNSAYIIHHAIVAYNPFIIKLLLDEHINIRIHNPGVIDLPINFAKRKLVKYYEMYNEYKKEDYITPKSPTEIIMGLGIIINKIANTRVIIRILESGGI